MDRVLVRKAIAAMEPCRYCGATAYDGCKMMSGVGEAKLPLEECPYYNKQGGDKDIEMARALRGEGMR